ncbi:hypothetical protein J4474_00895 [Candidatus Pacearchaeota archaeon]|nr:hypothetical protein [Candidatus Pacearchaeota archaeon]
MTKQIKEGVIYSGLLFENYFQQEKCSRFGIGDEFELVCLKAIRGVFYSFALRTGKEDVAEVSLDSRGRIVIPQNTLAVIPSHYERGLNLSIYGWNEYHEKRKDILSKICRAYELSLKGGSQ